MGRNLFQNLLLKTTLKFGLKLFKILFFFLPKISWKYSIPKKLLLEKSLFLLEITQETYTARTYTTETYTRNNFLLFEFHSNYFMLYLTKLIWPLKSKSTVQNPTKPILVSIKTGDKTLNNMLTKLTCNWFFNFSLKQQKRKWSVNKKFVITQGKVSVKKVVIQ